MEFSLYSASRTRRTAVRDTCGLPGAANYRRPGYAGNRRTGAHPASQCTAECTAAMTSHPLPQALQVFPARTHWRPGKNDGRFLDSFQISSRRRSGPAPSGAEDGDDGDTKPREPHRTPQEMPSAWTHLRCTHRRTQRRDAARSISCRLMPLLTAPLYRHAMHPYPPGPFSTGCRRCTRSPLRVATPAGPIR